MEEGMSILPSPSDLTDRKPAKHVKGILICDLRHPMLLPFHPFLCHVHAAFDHGGPLALTQSKHMRRRRQPTMPPLAHTHQQQHSHTRRRQQSPMPHQCAHHHAAGVGERVERGGDVGSEFNARADIVGECGDVEGVRVDGGWWLGVGYGEQGWHAGEPLSHNQQGVEKGRATEGLHAAKRTTAVRKKRSSILWYIHLYVGRLLNERQTVTDNSQSAPGQQTPQTIECRTVSVHVLVVSTFLLEKWQVFVCRGDPCTQPLAAVQHRILEGSSLTNRKARQISPPHHGA